MNDQTRAFFTHISHDQCLQSSLYKTHALSDVAQYALAHRLVSAIKSFQLQMVRMMARIVHALEHGIAYGDLYA